MRRIVVIVVCLLVFGSVSPVRASLPVEEALLVPGEQPYEINPYGVNELWISDWGDSSGITGKVILVNTTDSSTTTYSVPGLPTDARRDGNFFWWVDGEIGIIGRAEVGAGDSPVEYSIWQILDDPEIYFYPSFSGSMIDSSGRLWATDLTNPRFYRLTVNPISGPDELCTYFLPGPNNGLSSYMAYKDPFLWISDYSNSILYRLNVAANSFSSWSLPPLSSPTGMVVDAEGDVWYADWYHSVIGELNPDWDTGNGLLTSYPIGSDLTALMVAVEGNRIWFTGDNTPVIGILNPSTAAHSDLALTTMTGLFTYVCANITRTTDSLGKETTSFTWAAPPDYPLSYLANGLQIYQIPPDDAVNPSPWGIANQGGLMYVVDTGRQKLIKIPPPPDIIPLVAYLPLITR